MKKVIKTYYISKKLAEKLTLFNQQIEDMYKTKFGESKVLEEILETFFIEPSYHQKVVSALTAEKINKILNKYGKNLIGTVKNE